MSIEKTIQSCTAVPALHDIFLYQFKAFVIKLIVHFISETDPFHFFFADTATAKARHITGGIISMSRTTDRQGVRRIPHKVVIFGRIIIRRCLAFFRKKRPFSRTFDLAHV